MEHLAEAVDEISLVWWELVSKPCENVGLGIEYFDSKILDLLSQWL